jgi:hypothetical protein
MKPSYNIGARNGILEQKHFDKLGSAIWLYLWFLDKQPKDTDKVLGGQPITYEMFAKEFGKVSRRTYTYWLQSIVAGGYVSTLRTPRGSVITINKPKKWDAQKVAQQPKSDAQKVAHQKVSDAQDFSSDAQDLAKRCAKVCASNIKQTNTNNNKHIVSTNVDTGDDPKEQIKKLYYECIKAYKLPVLNHTTLRAKISAMYREDNPQTIINYLTFMRDQYQRIDMAYKPRISNALDLYTKRIQIKEAIQDHIKDQQSTHAWRPKSKGVMK